MTECKYSFQSCVPHFSGAYCFAYYNAIRPDGKAWMHFPLCEYKNCPLRHPELLEGATLEKEINDETLDR